MKRSYTDCPYCLKQIEFFEDLKEDGSFHITCPFCNKPFGICVELPVDVVTNLKKIDEYETSEINTDTVNPEVAQFILNSLDPSTPNTAPANEPLIIEY